MPKSKKQQRKPSKPNGKTSQRYSKRQRDIESVDMRDSTRLPTDSRGDSNCHVGKPNDWRWYAQTPQLVSDYASYPFGAPVGNLLQFGYPLYDTQSIPGVMALYFSPTVGYATDENSPINVAMRRLYSYVRHANSGASNYDAPDLMLYMICVDSALMYHEYLKRAYGVLQDYTAFNRYYPKALLAAMGINFDDITANIASFRGYINQYAVKLSQLWIPNSMSYMARHSWMCQGLYTDSTSEKAQTYLYVPDYFFQFQLAGDPAVGSAVAIPGPAKTAGGATFQQLMEFGNALLNPMIANEDFGIMSGDILKAFGSSGIVQPTAITDSYQVLPVYDQEVLSQMENASVYYLLAAGTSKPSDITTTPLLKVTQETAVGTGYLTSSPSFRILLSTDGLADTSGQTGVAQTILAPVYSNHLLNMHHSGVTPEEVMVATRLTNIANPIENVSGYTYGVTANVTFPTLGSEIITRGVIYQFGGSNGVTTGLRAYDVSSVMFVNFSGADNTYKGAGLQNLLTTTALLSNFDWHFACWPGIFWAAGANDMRYLQVPMPYSDTDYYTMLNQDNLKNMTLAAMLSEFSIPQI